MSKRYRSKRNGCNLCPEDRREGEQGPHAKGSKSRMTNKTRGTLGKLHLYARAQVQSLHCSLEQLHGKTPSLLTQRGMAMQARERAAPKIDTLRRALQKLR
eukprot:2796092-Pleurochrysis_carterae.AAC.1